MDEAITTAACMLLGLMERTCEETEEAIEFVAGLNVEIMTVAGLCPHCVTKEIMLLLVPSIKEGIEDGTITGKQRAEILTLLSAFVDEEPSDATDSDVLSSIEITGRQH
tara:strand:- start:2987 stop:3313 length:327 start_codon:yes stop_codon:yes gene_type:complete